MKKIEDYLHLYVGCNVQWTRCDDKIVTSKLTLSDAGWMRLQDAKLLLRPLSSMTEEEMYIILNELPNPFGQYIEDLGFIKPDAVLEDRSAPFLIYAVIPKLLSMGFDLFGLIDAGLALDLTIIEKA